MWVKLRHADGTVTLYGHVNTTMVRVGQRVMAGDQIATMGNRGNSTGPTCISRCCWAARNAWTQCRGWPNVACPSAPSPVDPVTDPNNPTPGDRPPTQPPSGPVRAGDPQSAPQTRIIRRAPTAPMPQILDDARTTHIPRQPPPSRYIAPSPPPGRHEHAVR